METEIKGQMRIILFIAQHIDSIIQLGLGVFFSWIAFRRSNKLGARTTKIFQVCGPALIVVGGLLLLKPTAAAKYKSMKYADAEGIFRSFVKERGKALDKLTPKDGVEVMVEFYRSVRVEDCDVAADGDMLLFQWGTHDWGDGERFEFDITRQFIPTEDTGEISQLSLTFKFEPETDLEELGDGNDWCHHPNELSEFTQELRSSEAYVAVRSRDDGEVALDQGDAE